MTIQIMATMVAPIMAAGGGAALIFSARHHS
jgi:hypothetical protein